ncbi:MAG: recombinase family protein [bacterium]
MPSQVDQVNYYVRSKPEIEVVKVYKEVHSAFKGNRPVFNQMLKDIKDHKNIKGLIVMKWDRISRNPDDYLKLQNIRGASNPIDIISVTEPMISSYLGRYMVRDLQNRSILYSEELSFRVKI